MKLDQNLKTFEVFLKEVFKIGLIQLRTLYEINLITFSFIFIDKMRFLFLILAEKIL